MIVETRTASESKKISNVLVLGGGAAGFLSALALKKRLPQIRISVLQSSKLGIIGVGEGSLRQLPNFLHEYLGIDPKRFFAEVAPTWKLGIRFLWGESGDFNYTFAPQVDVTHPHPDLPKPMGCYCFEEMENHCVASVLMRNDFVCLHDKNGVPSIGENVGYHLDNKRFAAFLEKYTLEQLTLDLRSKELLKSRKPDFLVELLCKAGEKAARKEELLLKQVDRTNSELEELEAFVAELVTEQRKLKRELSKMERIHFHLAC